jgi:hypothetical protein
MVPIRVSVTVPIPVSVPIPIPASVVVKVSMFPMLESFDAKPTAVLNIGYAPAPESIPHRPAQGHKPTSNGNPCPIQK